MEITIPNGGSPKGTEGQKRVIKLHGKTMIKKGLHGQKEVIKRGLEGQKG